MPDGDSAEPLRLSAGQLKRVEAVLLRCFSPALSREVAHAIYDELTRRDGGPPRAPLRPEEESGAAPWWPRS